MPLPRCQGGRLCFNAKAREGRKGSQRFRERKSIPLGFAFRISSGEAHANQVNLSRSLRAFASFAGFALNETVFSRRRRFGCGFALLFFVLKFPNAL